MRRGHGAEQRLADDFPRGAFLAAGKFGRLFPELPPLQASPAALSALAAAMVRAGVDNPTIPSGFTYLGQFIDHDITLDTTTLTEVAVDPTAIRNFRTPRLDLDSVYGLGPSQVPYLYDRQDPARLTLGATVTGLGDPTVPPALPNDLPRGPNGFALIGDHRNDENLIVAQLHLAFLKFHNEVEQLVRADGSLDVFADARELVTWHYQWIVLNEFLPKILDPTQLAAVLTGGRTFYKFGSETGSTSIEPFIPVEFGVAAYRLGHSMVRSVYDYNRVFRPGGVAPATLQLLFTFTGLSGTVFPVPSDWIIDWTRFFDFGGPNLNLSMALDPAIIAELANLPGGGGSLPERNLLRGRKAALPSAQDIAHRMGITPLTRAELEAGQEGPVLRQESLLNDTPLWYYILREAEVQQGGQRLGTLGSRIVAEVFVGLLDGDPASFRSKQPTWTPTLPAAAAGTFLMTDLLTLAFTNDPRMAGP